MNHAPKSNAIQGPLKCPQYHWNILDTALRRVPWGRRGKVKVGGAWGVRLHLGLESIMDRVYSVGNSLIPGPFAQIQRTGGA